MVPASPRALRALGGLWLALLLGVTATARAAPKSQDAKAVASARSLFYRALALQDQGKWAEALALLEKVAETRESAQVRFNIAFSQEHLGRLATAARGYERAIALARQSGAENVIHAANVRLAGLSGRVARLVLKPVGDGVSVTLDGEQLSAGDWGRPVPVEVGDHTIRAEASGYEPYRVSVNLPGGETRELRIELEPVRKEPPLQASREIPPVMAIAPVTTPAPVAAPPNFEAAPESSTVNALPYVAGGAAVLSLATAAVFYALRADTLDTMQERCRGGVCPEDARSVDERGAFYTTAANVALAAGVGLAGVSVGLFIAEVDGGDEQRRDFGLRVSASTAF